MYDMFVGQTKATCLNDLHVALGSHALFIHADSVDVVLLPAGQPRYLAGGAGGVARPPASLGVLSHGHVGGGALRSLPRHRDVVRTAGGVNPQLGRRTRSCAGTGQRVNETGRFNYDNTLK